MARIYFGPAIAVAMFLGAAAHASGARAGEPMVLTDAELDAVTAGGLVMGLGGEANAVGQSTLADGRVFSRVTDRPRVTIGHGAAAFTGAAQAQGDPAFAAANSYADVTGADLIITRTRTATGAGGSGDTTWSVETSRTRVIAIDIKGLELPNGPIVISRTSARNGPVAPPSLSGNVGTLNVDSKARGPNTLVTADGSVLTTGGFSSSSALVLTGAK